MTDRIHAVPLARQPKNRSEDTVMGLFDKKYCDICGEKIGLLGNRKLEDGNLCKDCAKKLSPFFNDRRNSTVEEIRQQLAYREKTGNNSPLSSRIKLSERARKFMPTRSDADLS